MVIVELTAEHSDELSHLILTDPPDYRKYFSPFSFQADSLAILFQNKNLDKYWGIRHGQELIGFFMLRGFDEGYQSPSFGVYIAKRFTHRGLSKLALRFALSWCRLNQVAAVMLKVHPENEYAIRTYKKAGFKFVEVCPTTGHDVLEKRWR